METPHTVISKSTNPTLSTPVKHNDLEIRKEKTRAQREFEAETTAFLVAQYFGIDTQLESAVYIKSWFPESKAEVVEKSFSEILETVKRIIDSVEMG